MESPIIYYPTSHKKWFTLTELIMVIMLISILFVAFRWYFQIKNKDILHGQSCIETIYGEVNNFLYAGLSSKSIYVGNTNISPDRYIIRFVPGQQSINLMYITWGIYTGTYKNILLTGNNTNMMYCSKSTYIIMMTWDTYEIHINKGLQENPSMQFFYLSGKITTWNDTFLQCYPQQTGCLTMARFESDTRTVSLKKQICLSFSDTGDCLQWDN